MFWSHEADVLVVGAGPVGLMSALMLAERGISVEVIDAEASLDSHNYALTLHPAALKLLDDVGVAGGLLPQGLRLDRVAFWDGERERAYIDFGDLPAEFPYLLVLPRMALERALERRLRERKVAVHWLHRLSQIADAGDHMACTVEQLGTDSGGYAISDTLLVVMSERHIKPKFVVGADGFHSMVRRRLGIDLVRAGPPQGYAPTEFTTDFPIGRELRVMFTHAGAALMFPLPGGGCRFTAELHGADIPPADSPQIHIGTRLYPELPHAALEKNLAERAPFHRSARTEVTWAASVRFEPALATRFGIGRGWLAGDAAHVTGPVGVQSMNDGLREAHDLGSRIAQVLKGSGAPSLLERYHSERTDEWRQLLGLQPYLVTTARTDPWVAQRAGQLISMIPATGPHLRLLAGQLGLGVAA